MSTKRMYWGLTALTLCIYATMLFWSLPAIAEAAGGLMAFDMRPAGYSWDEARDFLAALSPDGATFYRDVQLRLDILYPGLLAATLAWSIWGLAARIPSPMRLLLASSALPLAILDYVENAHIAQMLSLGPEALTQNLVAASSTWTVLKGQATTVAMSILLVLLCWRLIVVLRKPKAVAA